VILGDPRYDADRAFRLRQKYLDHNERKRFDKSA
jgi:hypothetical protein